MFQRNRIQQIILAWFTAAALSLSASPARAEAASFSLADLIQEARERSPEVLAAEAEWLAAKKRVWADSSLPDPMAGYDVMGSMVETRVGPQKNRFMIEQEIPFPGKLLEKARMALDEAKAAHQRYQAIDRDVTNKLTKLYYELYFIDASLGVIEEVKGLLKQFEGVARSRYAGVEGSQRDVAKAQSEVSMSLERIFLLKQEREIVAAMLNALLDRDPFTPVGRAALPEKPGLVPPLVDLVNLTLQNRQEIKEMEAMVSKSRHAKRLAKLAYIPDLKVGFEYTRVGSGSTMEAPDMDGRDSWMFPLRINIPLWQNRIIPEIQEAQKRKEASEARLLGARNTAFYEVKEAYHRFETAIKITELYETAVIPQAKLALASDRAAYEAGKSDFLNLVDSERVYLNAKLNHIQFYTEALKSYADLVRATGLDLKKEGRKSHEKK